MGLRVQFNLASEQASRSLTYANQSVNRSIQQMSTGRRLNAAQDDASGLAIAETMRAQVNGLNQATGNTQDGMILMQTAEGGMNEVHSMLQRMRELAVQSANDVLTASDRNSIRDEIVSLSAEIDRIGTVTQFNTKNLLDGSLATTGLTLQVGANSGDVFQLRIDTVSASNLGVMVSQLSVDNASNASTTISRLDAAIDKLSNFRGKVGSTVNRLEHAITNLDVMHERTAGSESRIRDLDMAKATTRLATGQLLSQSSTAMLAQANTQPQSVLSLLR